MKEGRCPMCNGTEIYASDQPTMGVNGDYLYLDVGDGLDLTAYVCMSGDLFFISRYALV